MSEGAISTAKRKGREQSGGKLGETLKEKVRRSTPHSFSAIWSMAV